MVPNKMQTEHNGEQKKAAASRFCKARVGKLNKRNLQRGRGNGTKWGRNENVKAFVTNTNVCFKK